MRRTAAGADSYFPPSSRSLGLSGRGPLIAHLLDSYLDRMKDSILLLSGREESKVLSVFVGRSRASGVEL